MAQDIVRVRAEKLQTPNSADAYDSRDSHSDDDDEDEDDGVFQLPGDFGSTLFQVSRTCLEERCKEKFDLFCFEVKALCEAHARRGRTSATCVCDIPTGEGYEAVFLEDLRAVFSKTGVRVMQVGGRVRPDVTTGMFLGRNQEPPPPGLKFTFVWGAVDRDGILRATGPTDGFPAIKPARLGPYQGPNESYATGPNVDDPMYPNVAPRNFFQDA